MQMRIYLSGPGLVLVEYCACISRYLKTKHCTVILMRMHAEGYIVVFSHCCTYVYNYTPTFIRKTANCGLVYPIHMCIIILPNYTPVCASTFSCRKQGATNLWWKSEIFCAHGGVP